MFPALASRDCYPTLLLRAAIAVRRSCLRLSQLDQAHADDGLNLAQRFDGGVGVACALDIDLDQRQRLPLRDALRADGAAEREVRDVQRMLAQDGPDAADDPGNVVVAENQQGPLQRCFDIDAVVGEQARRVAVQHGCRCAGVAVRRVQHQLQRASRAAAGRLLLLLLDANSALLGQGRGVNAVGVGALLGVALGVGEDAAEGGVADEFGLALRRDVRHR